MNLLPEISHADPGGAMLEKKEAVHALATGMYNMAYLIYRSIRAGVDQRILLRTFAYLILAVLSFLPADITAHLVTTSLSRDKAHALPDEALAMLLMPVVAQLLSEMQDVCSNDCKRVSTFERNALTRDRDEVDTYWFRLDPAGSNEVAETRNIVIEKFEAPCAVGFPVSRDHGCPLFAFNASVKNLGEFMHMIQRVAHFRKNEAATARDGKRIVATDVKP